MNDVLRWVEAQDTRPIPPEWVPGSSVEERRKLASLNSIAEALIDDSGGTSTVGPIEVERWLAASKPLPKSVFDACVSLRKATGSVWLSELYSALVSAKNRRHLGTFFTPQIEVERMVRQWNQMAEPPQTVIDVGAGVGIFTDRALHSWPTASVYAVDVNPVTLGLLGAHLNGDVSDVQVGAPTGRLQLVLDDYVSWFTENSRELGNNKLIIGNPPYTRLQLIPKAEREKLLEATNGLCGSRASLSAVMTAATLELLGPTDGLCLLLPTHWLESDYATALRDAIWALTSRPVDLHLFSANQFADARVDTVSLVIGPESSDLAGLRTSTEGVGVERLVDRGRPCPSNWRDLFRESSTPRPSRSAGSDRIRLGGLASIRRGAATGANHFFVVSEIDRISHALPPEFLRPLARRLRDFPGTELSSDDLIDLAARIPRWLLDVRPKDSSDPRVQSYLEAGLAQGAHLSFLCRRRTDWFDLSREIHVPDVIVGPMDKGEFRFVENTAHAVITNNLYGLTWNSGTLASTRDTILKWLRSPEGQAGLTAISRAQGEGLKKIGPRALQDLMVPRSFAQNTSQTR